MDLVTIVFGEEMPLLALQARSIARFVDPSAVGRILVVVNDFHEEACVVAVEALRPSYGPFADRLEILRPDALESDRPLGLLHRAERWYVKHGRGPIMRRLPRRQRLASGWRGNPGWSMQQAQKLLAVNAVRSPYVVILDSKNFFVAPAGLATFVAEDGRARSRRVPLGEMQRRWAQASFRALGLSLPPDMADLAPTVTPVALESSLMREGVREIEARVGSIEGFFSLRKGRATEFMMLFAAIDRGLGRWWERFADGLPEAATVYNKGDDRDVRETLQLALAQRSPLMGLHRRVLRRISDDTRDALADFWMDLGIVGNLEEAGAILIEAKS